MRAYVDSDVLIRHLRGDPRAESLLRSMDKDPDVEFWIGALQRAEILFFMKLSEERATRGLLSRFKTEPVTEQVVDAAAILYRRWNPTHGIDVSDAILAATVMTTGGKIVTLNVKHYPMPDVIVAQAW
ncbi:MAG: PIN domain-containing protein [Acidobacteria bacterium]|nr:PIN domain-containing protein [Acidobacteriota bacterium]